MADIYKTKEIETNINERGVNLGNVDVTLYTMDKGSAAFKIYLKREVDYANEKVYDPVNLYTTDMTPRIDIVAADGSVFANEPIDIVIPENGVIQYVVSDYVIRHAGKMDVYIYLENKSESVQVANFYFYIEEDGVTRRLGKEITGGRLEDVVKNVMSGQLMELLSEDFREQLEREIKTFLQDHNKDFNLRFEDLTREEKDELMKNLTNQGLADFRIEDNSISNAKLIDSTIRPEKTTFFDFNYSNNLIDKSKIVEDRTINSTGEWIDEDRRWTTHLIPLDSTKGEQINFTNDGSISYRIFLYNKNQEYIGQKSIIGDSKYVPTSNSTVQYVRISGRSDYNNIMINKGSKLLPYEKPSDSHSIMLKPEYYNSELKDNSVTPEKTTFIDIKDNKFDYTSIQIKKTLDSQGNIIDNDKKWLSDYIELDKDGILSVTQGSYTVGVYDSNKNFLLLGGLTNSNLIDFSLDKNARYVRISGYASPDTIMVNDGKTLQEYAPYGNVLGNSIKVDYKNISNKNIKPSDISNFKESNNLFNKSNVIDNTKLGVSGFETDENYVTSEKIYLNSGNITVTFKNTVYIAPFSTTDNRLGLLSSKESPFTYNLSDTNNVNYFRISVRKDDLDSLMINKGDKALPYDDFGYTLVSEPDNPIKIDPSLLSTNMNKGNGENNDNLTTKLPPVDREVYAPDIPKLKFEEIQTGYAKTKWLSEDGKRIYGATGSKLWISYDECQTLQIVLDIQDFYIEGIRELNDGELLFTTEKDIVNETQLSSVYRTKGFNKDTGTVESYEKILESPATKAKINNPWGVSVYDNVITLGEYGVRDLTGGRRAWISQDYGKTFTKIFDQPDLQQKIGDGPEWTARYHMHTCAYDPYWNRVWVVVGDHPQTASYYSDDFGETWNFIQGSDNYQLTGIKPLPHCVIFGSDTNCNGLFVYYRGNKSDNPDIIPLFKINDIDSITHVAMLPFKRDWKADTPLYFALPTAVGTTNNNMLLATVDGYRAYILHDVPYDQKFGGMTYEFLGTTAQGNIIATFKDNDIQGYRIGKAKAPTWTKI